MLLAINSCHLVYVERENYFHHYTVVGIEGISTFLGLIQQCVMIWYDER